MQYSGFVTASMTFDQLCAALLAKYPAKDTYIVKIQVTNTNYAGELNEITATVYKNKVVQSANAYKWINVRTITVNSLVRIERGTLNGRDAYDLRALKYLKRATDINFTTGVAYMGANSIYTISCEISQAYFFTEA